MSILFRIVSFFIFLEVIGIIGYTNEPDNPGIVMEFADGGSMDVSKLRTLWSSAFRADNLERCKQFALGIVEGLSYLHRNHVVHRDLKPDNILCFGQEPIPKISDFGLAKVSCTAFTYKIMCK